MYIFEFSHIRHDNQIIRTRGYVQTLCYLFPLILPVKLDFKIREGNMKIVQRTTRTVCISNVIFIKVFNSVDNTLVAKYGID